MLSAFEYKEKRSKFISHLYRVCSESDVKGIIDDLKKKHRKSAHICYAYIIDRQQAVKNDGEVGKPGEIMFRLLDSADLHSHLLITIRYFGGVKLGVGGVIRAFKESASGCVQSYRKQVS